MLILITPESIDSATFRYLQEMKQAFLLVLVGLSLAYGLPQGRGTGQAGQQGSGQQGSDLQGPGHEQVQQGSQWKQEDQQSQQHPWVHQQNHHQPLSPVGYPWMQLKGV